MSRLTVIAFAAIYFLWGSTYLAIRVLVETIPPLLAAGLRFFLAGLLLYLWSRLRSVPNPARREWRNIWMLGVLMFLAAYGGLFWAEKFLPSGVASVLVATIPVWTALFEIFVFRKQPFRWPVLAAIALGLPGVGLACWHTTRAVRERSICWLAWRFSAARSAGLSAPCFRKAWRCRTISP